MRKLVQIEAKKMQGFGQVFVLALAFSSREQTAHPTILERTERGPFHLSTLLFLYKTQ